MSVEALALMWRIERMDDVVLGMTNHDRDLLVDDVVYHAKGAFEPSILEKQVGLSSDNMEIIGGVDNALVRAEDIHLGLYDNAQVEHFLYDWRVGEKRDVLFSANIANIEFSENRFRAELHWPFVAINNIFGLRYSKYCRAVFCDQECGLDEKDFLIEGALVSFDENMLTLRVGHSNDPFKYGAVNFTNRPKGIARYAIRDVVKNGSEVGVELWSAPKFRPFSGELVQLIQGCDKRFESCTQLFGNAENFRGFPHMPGEDVLNETLKKEGARD